MPYGGLGLEPLVRGVAGVESRHEPVPPGDSFALVHIALVRGTIFRLSRTVLISLKHLICKNNERGETAQKLASANYENAGLTE